MPRRKTIGWPDSSARSGEEGIGEILASPTKPVASRGANSSDAGSIPAISTKGKREALATLSRVARASFLARDRLTPVPGRDVANST